MAAQPALRSLLFLTAPQGFPQEEHTDSGLADAAADGLRQFAVKECLLEWQLSPLFAACFF